MAEVTARSLARGSAYTWVAQIWRIASRLILTPLIIAKIGLEGYGTWTLLFSVCAYVEMFNASFGFAYSKFTAEYDRKKDYRGLSEIIGSGILLVSGSALAVLTTICLMRVRILRILNIPEDLMEDAGLALLIVATCVLLRMGVGCVFQVLAGLQRIDLQHKVMVLGSAVEFIVAIVMLLRGYGLVGLAVGYLCGLVLGTGVAWLLCRRLCPALHIFPPRVSRFGIRNILSLGGRFQLLLCLDYGIQQGVKILFSGLFGVAVLAVFELADKLLHLARSITNGVLAPLMPAFSNLRAGDDVGTWHALYHYSSKLVALTAATSLGALVVFADRVIVMWTGHEYPLAAWTIRVLAFGHFMWLMTGVGTASLRGAGTIGLEMSYGFLRTIMLVVLFAPAYWLRGYQGIVVALLISHVVGSTWFLAVFARREGLGFMHCVREILIRSLVIGAILTAAGLLFGWIGHPLEPTWPDRVRAIAEVTILGPLFAAAMVAALWYGSLSWSERQFLISRVLPEWVTARWFTAERPP